MTETNVSNPGSALTSPNRVHFVMKRDSLARDIVDEPLDPNEIRFALAELHNLISRIRSAAISRDLKSAYDRIAGITVQERTLETSSSEARACG